MNQALEAAVLVLPTGGPGSISGLGVWTELGLLGLAALCFAAAWRTFRRK